MSRSIVPVLLLAATLAAAIGVAHAQPTQNMEERLRAQLRITTTQLQQAQNELAALKASAVAAPARPAAPQADLEALRKELARSQSELASERRARELAAAGSQELRTQAQAITAKADAQLAQYHGAYDELLKLARNAEAERQRLAVDAATQRTAINQCEAKNKQLYAVGQEVLHAYETLDVASVLAARQPFAAQSRVKFEQIAQEFGDKLYESRFDVRALGAPGSATSSAPAVQPVAAPSPGAQP